MAKERSKDERQPSDDCRVMIHLLKTGGGMVCGIGGQRVVYHSEDINRVTCPRCIEIHEEATSDAG